MSDLSFQVRAPLGLELATGDVVTVSSWSLGGLEFPLDSDVLPSQGILSIPFQGVDIRFPVKFTKGSGERELLFDGLTGRQRETLAVFYRSILSGRMASTEDVITSLDTPVDLVPMEETEEERTESTRGKTPRIFRVLWSLSVYALVALVIFGMLGDHIWSRISGIDVARTRVVAETWDHRASTGAYVEKILVAEGDVVEQGQTLVILNSPGHRGTLTDLRADIRLAESNAARARDALELHLEGLAEARRPYERALAEAIAARPWPDLLADYNMEEIRRAQQALALFDAGVSQSEGDFHDRRDFLLDVLRARKAELAQLKRRLSAEKTEGGAANILALEDGVVTELPIFEDQFLSRGDIALTLEGTDPPVVVGWLDEGLAAAVYPGMAAEMTANTGGDTRRISGTVQEVLAMPDPDRAGQFGLRVVVHPDDWVARDAPELLRNGAPMELRLDRGGPWISWIREITDVRP